MTLLFRLVYATHAIGTHHKLALDALRHLENNDAERWTRLFLKHAEVYLEGSKAPDTQFKDFKNHVLHVREGYWGGAPEKVVSWYGHLVTALRNGEWSEAAYCAGVLSHYYTDPIQPLHTAQSEAENSIHRAVEWSISRSYDELRRQGDRAFAAIDVEVPPGPHWLKDMVCRGAELANRHYEALIVHYDFHRGVVAPPEGLDETSRALLAELITYAAKGYARILDRAFAEAAVAPPEVTLTAETFLAALKIPLKVVQKRLADSTDRRVVEAMYDELKATGRVEASLPEDDRIIRDLHASEVLAPRARERSQQRNSRLPGRDPAEMARERQRHQPVVALPPAAPAGTLATAAAKAAPAKGLTSLADARSTPPEHRPAPALMDAADRRLADALTAAAERRRVYLATGDHIEAAPSIGAKTAQRLGSAGIKTVGDLLAADPDALAPALGVRHITPARLRDWQDQARLVMTVPGLRGTHAQLLVGAGYKEARAIAEADADVLSAAVLKFAATSEGERILRAGDAPDLEKIRSWIESALSVVAEAA